MVAISLGFLLPSLFVATAVVSEPTEQLVFQKELSDDTSHGIVPVLTPELSTFIERNLASWNISGLTAAAVHNGKVELGAWGNKTETGDEINADTLFNIASCSKAFLGTAMGILMDDFSSGKNVTSLPPNLKKFDWNTKVKDLLPGEWELMDKWASENANVRDILAHVSGLSSHEFSYSLSDDSTAVLNRMKHLRPAYELRQQYSYNNQMYVVGSHIISTYAGIAYTSFLKERIFVPLNMTSTTFSLNEAIQSGNMTQSWTRFGRRIPPWLPEESKELIAGPGGIISNANDLAKWLKILVNSGKDVETNRSIIPKTAFDETTTAQVVMQRKAPVIGYGIGWERSSYRGYEFISHAGGIPGFSTIVTFLPTESKGLAILVNADKRQLAVNSIQNRILDAFLGLDSPENISSSNTLVSRTRSQSSDARVSLPLPLHYYSGTYSNPGYGVISICAPSSPSFYCKEVLSDFDLFRPEQRNLSNHVHGKEVLSDSDLFSSDSQFEWGDQPRLFAKWPRVWTSHLRFVHRDGNKFDAEFTALFPQGYGTDNSPFEVFEPGGSGIVQFVIEDGQVIGFGLKQTTGKIVESVQSEADAWFLKV